MIGSARGLDQTSSLQVPSAVQESCYLPLLSLKASESLELDRFRQAGFCIVVTRHAPQRAAGT